MINFMFMTQHQKPNGERAFGVTNRISSQFSETTKLLR